MPVTEEVRIVFPAKPHHVIKFILLTSTTSIELGLKCGQRNAMYVVFEKSYFSKVVLDHDSYITIAT